MKTVNKKLLAVAVAGVLGMGAVPAMADGLSANVGMVSNYVWRGDSQTNDKAAIQGGFDYAKGPVSIGTWASSLVSGTEIDLYGSYSFGPVTVGLIDYYYTADNSNSYELNIGGDLGPVSLMYSYAPDGGAWYAEGSYSMEISKGYSLGVHVGTTDASEADYTIGVSTSAGGFDLGLTGYGKQNADSGAFVSVSKSM